MSHPDTDTDTDTDSAAAARPRVARAGSGLRGSACVLAVTGIGLAAAGSLPAQSSGEMRSVRSGVYTAAQAGRGERTYEEKCLNCHATEQFVGPAYMNSWTSQPALAWFQAIRSTMPQDNPGSLRRQEYADLLAYLLKLNDMPAGDEELKGTDAALTQILIEGPYKTPAGGSGEADGRPSRSRGSAAAR